MGSKPNTGSTNEPNDDEENESPVDKPGLGDFRDPPEKDEKGPESEASGGGSVGRSTTEAGSSPVVKRPQKSGNNTEDGEDEIDTEEEGGSDASSPGAEDESDSEDTEDTESDVITIVQEVDPLSYASWDMQPVMLRVAEQYRGQVELKFVSAPLRDFDGEMPETRNGMPLNESLYSDQPASTENVNRAWIAAKQQGRGRAYLRRLWIDTFARGRNLDAKLALVDVADDMGLDMDQFEEDMEDADLSDGTVGELPTTEINTARPATLSGYLRYSEFGPRLAPEGVSPEPPRALPEFIRDCGPVATAEVREVYGFDSLEDAESELRDAAGVEGREIGIGTFWEPT